MSITRASPVLLDVCFLIIDTVGNDDEDPNGLAIRYTTLRACALTCQDWLEKSRAQLYRSVVLQPRDDFEYLTETLASSSGSHLGSLVKSLRCELTSLMHAGNVDQAPLPMHVIRRLVSLESLTVVSDIMPFSPSFVEFLKSFSACTTLDSLYIRGCHFVAFENLAAAVRSFPHIKSLQIRQCAWYSRGSMNWSAYPEFDRLTTVKLHLSVDMDSLYALLRPTVEHLSLWEVETPGMHETYRAWEVSRLRSLKSLEFTFAREDLHWVVRTLVNNGSRVLETVAFNYLSTDQTPETVRDQLTKQVIDGILRASPFASVRRVVVKLFANDPSDDGERWSRAVQAALPRTHELKMLRFSVHQYVEADWNKDWWIYWSPTQRTCRTSTKTACTRSKSYLFLM